MTGEIPQPDKEIQPYGAISDDEILDGEFVDEVVSTSPERPGPELEEVRELLFDAATELFRRTNVLYVNTLSALLPGESELDEPAEAITSTVSRRALPPGKGPRPDQE